MFVRLSSLGLKMLLLEDFQLFMDVLSSVAAVSEFYFNSCLVFSSLFETIILYIHINRYTPDLLSVFPMFCIDSAYFFNLTSSSLSLSLAVSNLLYSFLILMVVYSKARSST